MDELGVWSRRPPHLGANTHDTRRRAAARQRSLSGHPASVRWCASRAHHSTLTRAGERLRPTVPPSHLLIRLTTASRHDRWPCGASAWRRPVQAKGKVESATMRPGMAWPERTHCLHDARAVHAVYEGEPVGWVVWLKGREDSPVAARDIHDALTDLLDPGDGLWPDWFIEAANALAALDTDAGPATRVRAASSQPSASHRRALTRFATSAAGRTTKSSSVTRNTRAGRTPRACGRRARGTRGRAHTQRRPCRHHVLAQSCRGQTSSSPLPHRGTSSRRKGGPST